MTTDISLIRQLLSYEPDTGCMYWKPRTPELCEPTKANSAETVCSIFNARWAGQPALRRLDQVGYLGGRLLKKIVKTHRIAWAIHYGEWPEVIDHINGNRADNRIVNLRSVTHKDNAINRVIGEAGNGSDVGLVKTAAGSWAAWVRVENRYLQLGTFPTKAEAIAARNAAVKVCTFSRKLEIIASEVRAGRPELLVSLNSLAGGSDRPFHSQEVA